MVGKDSDYIRQPAWAGSFYEADPDRLKSSVLHLFDKALPKQVPGHIMGLITPHAGYEYSGSTAAAAYKLVMDDHYEAVVVIAPSHHELVKGISIFPGRAYETPLGEVAVDQQLAEDIEALGRHIHFSMSGHRSFGNHSEHSLEVQLPFLQKAFPNGLKIVPIVFHDYSLENCMELGNAVASAAKGKNVLIVASSDLYHGYSYDDCRSTDDRTLNSIEAFDPEDLCQGLSQGIYQACGGGPIAALLFATKKMGANLAQVIMRTNSSDITGMRGGWTVGYASVAISKVTN
jgi:AmmeMemoRadiSam system protein B